MSKVVYQWITVSCLWVGAITTYFASDITAWPTAVAVFCAIVSMATYVIKETRGQSNGINERQTVRTSN